MLSACQCSEQSHEAVRVPLFRRNRPQTQAPGKCQAVCKDDPQLSILQPEETLIHGTQDFECWSSLGVVAGSHAGGLSRVVTQ